MLSVRQSLWWLSKSCKKEEEIREETMSVEIIVEANDFKIETLEVLKDPRNRPASDGPIMVHLDSLPGCSILRRGVWLKCRMRNGFIWVLVTWREWNLFSFHCNLRQWVYTTLSKHPDNYLHSLLVRQSLQSRRSGAETSELKGEVEDVGYKNVDTILVPF